MLNHTHFLTKRSLKKGQSAFEITAITAIMLFVFIIFIGIVGNNAISAKRQQDTQILEEVAATVSDEIRLASISEEGYVRSFEVADTVFGINYTVTFLSDPLQANHSEVIVKSANSSTNIEAVEIMPVDIKGSLVKGTNTITKKNGRVCINLNPCI